MSDSDVEQALRTQIAALPTEEKQRENLIAFGRWLHECWERHGEHYGERDGDTLHVPDVGPSYAAAFSEVWQDIMNDPEQQRQIVQEFGPLIMAIAHREFSATIGRENPCLPESFPMYLPQKPEPESENDDDQG